MPRPVSGLPAWSRLVLLRPVGGRRVVYASLRQGTSGCSRLSAVRNDAAVSICVPALPDLGWGDIPMKTHRKLRVSDVENAFPTPPLANVTAERGPPEAPPERSREPAGAQSGHTKPV